MISRSTLLKVKRLYEDSQAWRGLLSCLYLAYSNRLTKTAVGTLVELIGRSTQTPRQTRRVAVIGGHTVLVLDVICLWGATRVAVYLFFENMRGSFIGILDFSKI
jgi:hypothetical protein